jgi:hypothetical protein
MISSIKGAYAGHLSELADDVRVDHFGGTLGET